MMKKRMMAIVLSAVLAVGSIVPAFAQEELVESVAEEIVIDETDDEDSVEEIVIEESDDEEIVETEEAIVESDIESDDEVIVEAEDAEETEDSANALVESAEDSIAKHFSPSEDSFHEDLRNMISVAEQTSGGAISEMTSEACLKRLIVYKGYNSLTSDYNAINAASSGTMTVLQYATEAATKKAYDSLKKQLGDGYVFYDHIETITDNEDFVEASDIDEFEIEAEDASAMDSVNTTYDPVYFAKKMGAPTFVGNMSSTMKNKKIIVAVLDTGLNTSHEKIKGKYVSGYSYYNSGSYIDDNGHGTMCAGCVLGVTKGTNVKVMPVKVMSSGGSGYSSTIAAGIEWAYNHGAKVINMSLGGTHWSEGYSCGCYGKQIDAAYKKNVTIVVSAGNENCDIDYYGVHPAEFRKCITVAAVDKDMARAYFSNYGKAVDVTNYGVDIYMPYYTGSKDYRTASGTSFSCPLTSGAAALLYASGVATKPANVEKTLRGKAKDLGSKGWDQYFGAGIVRIGGIKVAGKIGWSSDSLKMSVGDKKTGTFSNPNKAKVTFKSDNKAVVAVDSKGNLTAKKRGSAMITAITGGKRYYCKVTVIQPRITGKSSVKVKKTITLKMADGKGTTKWYSSNKSIATVTSKGVVKGVKKGSVKIVAINNGTAYIKSITVK